MSMVYKINGRLKSKESYSYCNTSYEFDVIRIMDGRIVKSFTGSWSQGISYNVQTGVICVTFSGKNKILIENFGGDRYEMDLE